MPLALWSRATITRSIESPTRKSAPSGLFGSELGESLIVRSKTEKRNTPPASLKGPHPEGHVEPGKPNTALGFERLLFFSDAVLAIAITLLAIELKLPETAVVHDSGELGRHLMEMGGKFLSFFISFTVIGLYWLSHHRLFAYIRRYDATLLWLNLLFLLGITFLPFATGLLGSHIGFFLTRTLYAVTVAFIGLAQTLIWVYATRKHRLVDRELDGRLIRILTLRSLVPPVVFLLSIPLASVAPGLALVLWSLTAFANVLIPGGGRHRSRGLHC